MRVDERSLHFQGCQEAPAKGRGVSQGAAPPKGVSVEHSRLPGPPWGSILHPGALPSTAPPDPPSAPYSSRPSQGGVAWALSFPWLHPRNRLPHPLTPGLMRFWETDSTGFPQFPTPFCIFKGCLLVVRGVLGGLPHPSGQLDPGEKEKRASPDH